MNNIYTEISTLLEEPYISQVFEISELADAPVMMVREDCGVVTTESDTLDSDSQQFILKQYRFDELLSAIDGVDLTILGYVVGREFFVFSVWQKGDEFEMSPERRAAFMEFFNLNLVGVKLRHVPVFPQQLRLDKVKGYLQQGKSKRSDLEKYTVKEIVELCAGISPMTKKPRKGLVFKSLTSPYCFKALSENAMMNMMGSL